MELDWENLLDDWDGEDCWRNWAWENCSGPKRNSGYSPTGIVRLRVGIVLRPRVGRVHVFRRYLMSLKNRTLFENMVWCLTI